jgi:hypothetical protein
MSTNPNEPYPYDIVHATRWSKGSNGERKSRMVVLKYNPPAGIKMAHKYALRWQTDGGDDGPTFGGGTFATREKAHERFWKEYLDHNEQYRKGNISHLPGVAK